MLDAIYECVRRSIRKRNKAQAMIEYVIIAWILVSSIFALRHQFNFQRTVETRTFEIFNHLNQPIP